MKLIFILFLMLLLISICFYQINELQKQVDIIESNRLNYNVALSHTFFIYGEAILTIYDIMKSDPFFRDELKKKTGIK